MVIVINNLAFSFLLFAFFTSCSTHSYQRAMVMESYQSGNLGQADQILTERINHELPQGKFWKGNDAVCLLLDRATTRFVENEIEASIADYSLAIEALDFYGQDSTLESSQQILLEDGSGAYRGSDVEHILARVYFALALCHQGDVNNATALLKQAEEFQQQQTPSFQKNELAKYLLACLLDHHGDKSNASILFQQAEQLAGSLPPSIDLVNQTKSKEATLLFICHNGNVPYKISATSPASLASAVALELFLSTQRIDPAISSFTGIPCPRLIQKTSSHPLPTFIVKEGVKFRLPFGYDVAAAEYEELELKKPVIVARGVARFFIRRSAVAYAQKCDPCVGIIADLGMLVVNAQTEADTRSWTTLPSSIDIMRFRSPVGKQIFTVIVERPLSLPFQQTIHLDLKEGDLCVVNIFNLNPNLTKILIPKKFQSIQ